MFTYSYIQYIVVVHVTLYVFRSYFYSGQNHSEIIDYHYYNLMSHLVILILIEHT